MTDTESASSASSETHTAGSAEPSRNPRGTGPPGGAGGLRRRGQLAFALAACLAGWVAMRRNVLFGVDLGLHDETATLAVGEHFLHDGTLSLAPANSPLYGLWHALWLSLAQDPLSSYYVQWLATDLFVLLAVLATARRLGMGYFAAGAAALVWSSTTVAATGWPRVYMLALLVVLLGYLGSRALDRAWPGAVALGLAAFIRPEFQLSVLLFCALLVRGRLPRRYWNPLTLLALVVLLVSAFSVSWGGGRMWIAFAQHVSLRYAESHPGALVDPWVQAFALAGQMFPGAGTISEAIHVAPGTVLLHVARNLAEYPLVIVTSVANWPHAGFPMGTWPGRLLLVAAGAIIIIRFVRRRRTPDAADRRPLLDPGRGGWRYLACAASAVISSLLVMPKATYAILLVLAVVLYCVAAVASVGRRWAMPRGRGAFVVPGLVLAGLAIGPWLRPAPRPPVRVVLLTAMSLQRLWAPQPATTEWRMLEADGGWCVYLDIVRCTPVRHSLKTRALPWSRLLAEQKVNAVLVTPRLAIMPSFHDDPEFRAFIRNPATSGFGLVFTNGWASLYLRDPAARRSH